jgi:hypothetical protein
MLIARWRSRIIVDYLSDPPGLRYIARSTTVTDIGTVSGRQGATLGSIDKLWTNALRFRPARKKFMRRFAAQNQGANPEFQWRTDRTDPAAKETL